MDEIIQEIKQSSNVIIKEALSINKKFNEMYSSILYSKFKDDNDIKFTEMNTIDVGTKYELFTLNGETIITELLSKSDDIIHYKTMFSSDAILVRHNHSDCEEHIEVLSDSSFKIIVGSKIKGTYTEHIMHTGDTITIERGISHQFVNLDDSPSGLNVTFTR